MTCINYPNDIGIYMGLLMLIYGYLQVEDLEYLLSGESQNRLKDILNHLYYISYCTILHSDSCNSR